MIDAEIRKKIRQGTAVSQLEDVLTSNVFGLMRMLPNHLIKILTNAKHIRENKKLSHISSSTIDSNSFELWKIFQNKNERTDKKRDEPDVYFELNNGKKIIIEVKYLSGESDENQLIDYTQHCDYLIYLTFFNEHRQKAKEKYSNHEKIYLLTWREFCSLLKEMSQSNSAIESALINHISNYLDYKIGSIWDGWSQDFGKTIYPSGGFYCEK